jgi:uncharacterized protein YndB with AHSA1/START domain
MRLWGLALAAAGVLMWTGAANATVAEATPTGFQVQQKVEIAAPASKVWAALSKIGQWWDSQHTWSSDAKNLTLSLTPGGCFCEAFPHGGGARHMTVMLVSPSKTVVMEGALGPLIFSGATGHLVWNLSEAAGKTTLTQIYYVGGEYPGGLDKMAGAVDGVLSEQITRLKAYIETGKPAI